VKAQNSNNFQRRKVNLGVKSVSSTDWRLVYPRRQ
jgi:hypothetical protein